MFVTGPVFTITSDEENMDKVIEDEDAIATDQVIFLVGENIIINGEFTVLGQMVII